MVFAFLVALAFTLTLSEYPGMPGVGVWAFQMTGALVNKIAS